MSSGLKRTIIDFSISDGSRPTSAQWRSSTETLWCQSSGSRIPAFQWSAQRATVRRVRRSPEPPITIGGRGRCGPFGSFRAFVTEKYLPSNVVSSSDSIRATISTPSSKRSNRSVRVSPSVIP